MSARMAREIKLLTTEPPPGVCAWPTNDRYDEISAQIQGPKGSVYERGIFTLSVHVPPRYPFEPPQVRFVTPVYHPNIDNGGRICLDILNMPPKGAWRPALNISTVLASIGLLLADPNPEDGLMTEVAAEYKLNRAAFDMKARQMTEKHAVEAKESAATYSAVEEAAESESAAPSAEASPAEPAAAGPGSSDQAKPSVTIDSCSTAPQSPAEEECLGGASNAKENNNILNHRNPDVQVVTEVAPAAAAPRNRLSLKKRMRVS